MFRLALDSVLACLQHWDHLAEGTAEPAELGMLYQVGTFFCRRNGCPSLSLFEFEFISDVVLTDKHPGFRL